MKFLPKKIDWHTTLRTVSALRRGTSLGSRQNEEARIDSLAQSWSVIIDAGDLDQSAHAMRSVEEYLVRRTETVLLFTPAFEHSRPHTGYIMAYLPGVRENGGQCTHGALRVVIVFGRSGDVALARIARAKSRRNPSVYMRTCLVAARIRDMLSLLR